MGVAILGEVFVGMSLAATIDGTSLYQWRGSTSGRVLRNFAAMLTGEQGSALGAVFSLLVGGKLIEANGPEGFRIVSFADTLKRSVLNVYRSYITSM
ncbi:hypothetical protein LTR69_006199 [Exophiala sideris]|uniref:Uncharacterized protein n=1 Tax=Exophiala sideris TaxID=1016849 RepID=A0ABR0JAI3_9EURO|nr:hypothetical protein LTR69_006199 [Exophiala sideris]